MKKVITALTATAAISTYGLSQDASANNSTGTYSILNGDTLWGIAQSNGLTVDQLKSYNNLSSDLIHAGSELKLSEQSKSTPSTYTVKAGDTLWGIGNRYNVSVADLKEWNSLSSDLILVNQTLTLQGEAEEEVEVVEVEVETEAVEETEVEVEDIQVNADTYTVKPGDTLYSIASEFGMTYRTLMSINGLTDYLIYPGDILNVSGEAQAVEVEEPAEAEEDPAQEEIVEEAPAEEEITEEVTEEPSVEEVEVEVEPVVEEAPVQEEEAPVQEEEAPVQEEEAIVEEEPEVEETEEAPVEEEPVQEEIVEEVEPEVEEAPAQEEIEVESEPIVEEAPAQEEFVEEEPAVEEEPVQEEIAEEVEEEAPAAEEETVEEEEIEEEASEEVAEEEPEVEAEPVQEEVVKEVEETPAIEEVPVEEEVAEEEPAQDEIVEEEPEVEEVEPAAEVVEEVIEEEPEAQPEPSNITGESYTVQSGDTLASIAKRAGMSYNDIMTYNEMDSVLIYPGLVLDLVDNRPAEPVQEEEVGAPAEEVQPEPTPEPVVEEVVEPEPEPVVEETQTPEVQAPATATASYGTNWYPHGECTWYAFERRKQLGKPASGSWGDAKNWASAARSQGLTVNNTPSVGAIIQTGAWSNGAYSFGHVGVVEQVNPDGSIMISEMNWSGGLGGKSFRTLSASQAASHNFIH